MKNKLLTITSALTIIIIGLSCGRVEQAKPKSPPYENSITTGWNIMSTGQKTLSHGTTNNYLFLKAGKPKDNQWIGIRQSIQSLKKEEKYRLSLDAEVEKTCRFFISTDKTFGERVYWPLNTIEVSPDKNGEIEFFAILESGGKAIIKELKIKEIE